MIISIDAEKAFDLLFFDDAALSQGMNEVHWKVGDCSKSFFTLDQNNKDCIFLEKNNQKKPLKFQMDCSLPLKRAAGRLLSDIKTLYEVIINKVM